MSRASVIQAFDPAETLARKAALIGGALVATLVTIDWHASPDDETIDARFARACERMFVWQARCAWRHAESAVRLAESTAWTHLCLQAARDLIAEGGAHDLLRARAEREIAHARPFGDMPPRTPRTAAASCA